MNSVLLMTLTIMSNFAPFSSFIDADDYETKTVRKMNIKVNQTKPNQLFNINMEDTNTTESQKSHKDSKQYYI